MQKRDQTKSKSGIETTPDCGMNMDFLVQMDIIFIKVKDRSRQSPTTSDLWLVKATEYQDLVTRDLLVTLCEEQESLIQEQEQRIKELETHLQDHEQEIYEKDQALQLAAEPELQILRSNNSIQEESCIGENL